MMIRAVKGEAKKRANWLDKHPAGLDASYRCTPLQVVQDLDSSESRPPALP